MYVGYSTLFWLATESCLQTGNRAKRRVRQLVDVITNYTERLSNEEAKDKTYVIQYTGVHVGHAPTSRGVLQFHSPGVARVLPKRSKNVKLYTGLRSIVGWRNENEKCNDLKCVQKPT